MKTIEEIHEIRNLKRKELDLRVNTKADTTYQSLELRTFALSH